MKTEQQMEGLYTVVNYDDLSINGKRGVKMDCGFK